MDQHQTDRRQGMATDAVRQPSIYYLHPLLGGKLRDWPARLQAIADMGFSHVALAPPFAARSVLLADDFDAPHPALAWDGDAGSALAFIDAACRAIGLAWLLDVTLDRVAPDGAVARDHPALFAAPVRAAIDPRCGPAVAHARFDTQGEVLAEWWGGRLAEWSQAGAAGFRLLGLDATPAPFLRALRSKAPAGVWLGWTEGLDESALADLAGCGLDYASIALQGWDFVSEALWTRLRAVERVAPAIACVEAPFGHRAAADVADTRLLGPALGRLAATAAALGRGWLMPMGFEHGATTALDARRSIPQDLLGDTDLAGELRAINAAAAARTGRVQPVAAAGLTVTAFVRGVKRPRELVLVNPDLTQPRGVALAEAAAALGCDTVPAMTLEPAEVRVVALSPMRPIRRGRQPRPTTAEAAAKGGRIAIERITPQIEGGRFAVKACVGDTVTVEADIICDGHDKLAAVVQWRPADQPEWSESRMTLLGNDRWQGSFAVPRIGRWLFRVQTWRDAFATFRDELAKKTAAGIDVRLEVMEGQALVETAAAREPALVAAVKTLSDQDRAAQVATLLGPELLAAMAQADPRPFSTTGPLQPVEVDRVAARFASWYEIFPRSMSGDGTRHGTFDDVIRALPRIRDMGFDVLYFPPISPIGRTNRKGRNNTLTPAADDPGSPYAIGNEQGGHDAIHPELGTLDDFRRLREEAADHGLELALDFAIQCSPDHPWLREHKGWFAWRPDGSMRYAENPPKKYEDIVNVDFYAGDAVPDLWVALCEVVLFWVQQGVRVFRVDNPHTKPLPFWEWLIAEVRSAHPGAIFLAEAFTRPKVMNRLGKLGFTQSYTYFTWRNTKRELTEYLTELTTTDQRDFFRPNFFVNTPDINPPFLQTGGRAAHLIRATLAATLSGLWGVYCGFELCEATPIPGREEYMDSEKYQFRAWDWERPGNIVAEIAQLNRLRRANPALQTHLGVTFLPADNDQILFFEKATPDRANVVLVAVSLDPYHAQSAAIELPLWQWRLPDHATLACEDLLHDVAFTLTSKWQRVGLSPEAPCTIWRARPAV
jgi:starch synthase (maltosyl-transferring)